MYLFNVFNLSTGSYSAICVLCSSSTPAPCSTLFICLSPLNLPSPTSTPVHHCPLLPLHPCSSLPSPTSTHVHHCPLIPPSMFITALSYLHPCSSLPSPTSTHVHHCPLIPPSMFITALSYLHPCSSLPSHTSTRVHHYPLLPPPTVHHSTAHFNLHVIRFGRHLVPLVPCSLEPLVTPKESC